MARKITSVFTRPDVNIPWFQETFSQEHRDYMKETYFDTGKAESTWETSADGLTLTMVLVINDPSTWGQDLTLLEKITQRDEYNLLNNIVNVSTDIELI